ncbi:Odorant receptor Or76 [Rhyzopertha dominica]|nr:Odorant receptor Or76 [Rhyzopertha dominica]
MCEEIVAVGYRPMKEDYLEFFKKLPMVYYNYVAFRIVMKFLTFTFFVFNGILTVMSLIHGWNIQRLFLTAVFVSALCQIGVVYLMDGVYEEILTLGEEMQSSFWSIEAASEELLTYFEGIFDILRVNLRLLWVKLAILWVIAVLTRFFPNWPIDNFLRMSYNIVYCLNAFFGAILVAQYCIIFYYYCIHVYVQTKLLGQYFSNVDKDLENVESDNRDRIINKRLLIGIQQHKNLRRFADHMKRVFSGKRILMLFITVVMCVPLWLFWILLEGTLVIAGALILIMFLVIAFAISGEMFTQGYKQCPEQLYKNNWYDWNKDNKQLFRLFVALADDEQIIRLIPSFSVRATDLLKYLKMLYSITALLVSVYKK